MTERNIKELTAIRPGEGRTKSLNLKLNGQEYIGQGMLGNVYRLRLDRGEGKAPAYFAYKKLHFPSSDDQILDDAIEIQKRILSIEGGHKHTVPTLRQVEGGLLMTDLSNGGENIVLSINDSPSEIIRQVREIEKNNPDFVQTFLNNSDVMSTDWNDIYEKKAKKFAQITSDAGISISGDSIFTVILPDGDYELKVVDMDNVELATTNEDFKDQNYKKTMDFKPLFWLIVTKLTKYKLGN